MTSTTAPAPTADQAGAVAHARARTQRQYRATGTYPVTVGGIVVGEVERHSLATSKTAVWWTATDNNGVRVASGLPRRADAVEALAETEFAAKAYREAAREGTFGTAEERRVREEDAARLAELDAEDTPAPAPVAPAPAPAPVAAPAAAPVARPRAAKLRTYRVEGRFAFVPREYAEVAGFARHHVQGEIVVTAPSKAAAVARLTELGMRQTPHVLSVVGGTHDHALLDSGLAAADGTVIVYHAAQRDQAIVRIPPGTALPELVAHWRVYDAYRGQPSHRRGGSFLQRASDGALFPARADADPATPVTGWTDPAKEA